MRSRRQRAPSRPRGSSATLCRYPNPKRPRKCHLPELQAREAIGTRGIRLLIDRILRGRTRRRGRSSSGGRRIRASHQGTLCPRQCTTSSTTPSWRSSAGCRSSRRRCRCSRSGRRSIRSSGRLGRRSRKRFSGTITSMSRRMGATWRFLSTRKLTMLSLRISSSRYISNLVPNPGRHLHHNRRIPTHARHLHPTPRITPPLCTSQADVPQSNRHSQR